MRVVNNEGFSELKGSLGESPKVGGVSGTTIITKDSTISVVLCNITNSSVSGRIVQG